MNSEPICELTNVSKSFRGRKVVNSLSLTVGRGEMIALTGKSGTGKSTVLNMIGLLDSFDSGAVSLFGGPAPRVKSKQAEKLLRHRLGYLFQNYALIDGETADYNLRVAQKYARTPRRERADVRSASLHRTGLEGFADRKVYELSGGEQQRLALARLMLKPCELVLADEPTGSLDAENRDHILDILSSMRNYGKTIVIVTHDSVVADACDRIVSLEDTAGTKPIQQPDHDIV
ncbi:ABC transporter ATP-binding protein [Arthrobacter sp. 2MCAF14]|uniref:ABC transporter ATP-binding protein n=1 Tax=Arthrobacter sp. 2MCAF14 TaxID=3232982 RepID=UPI003F907C2B